MHASLTPEAKRLLNDLAEELGMKHKVLFERMLEWFVRLDRHVHLVALKQIPKDQEGDIVEVLYRQHHPELMLWLNPETAISMAREIAKSMQIGPAIPHQR